MLDFYIQNRPVQAQAAIALKSGDQIYEVAIGTFSYKIANKLYTYYNAGTKDVKLSPAFTATHLYYKGEIIVDSGYIYAAKKTFTSAATFKATDRNLVRANDVTNGYQVMYTVCRAGGATGDQTNRIYVSDLFDKANPFETRNIAPQLDQSEGLAPIYNIYIKNEQAGAAALVPDTTSLVTSGITTKASMCFGQYGS